VPSKASRKQEKERLLEHKDGRLLIRCPRCRRQRDILELTVYEEKPFYSDETVPVYRDLCGWVFALKIDAR